jgi:hypothetical protein
MATAEDWKKRMPQTGRPVRNTNQQGRWISPTAMDARGVSASDMGRSLDGVGASLLGTGMEGDPALDRPPGPGPGPGGGGGGRGGFGGGGGPRKVDTDLFLQLANRTPQAYDNPEEYVWDSYDYQDFDAPEFEEFNSGIWEENDAEIGAAGERDRSRGMGGYADARVEAEQYRNPFQRNRRTTGGAMSGAMQRMMQQNGASFDPQDIAQGVNADAAFGYLMDNNAAFADRSQDATMRALSGDERRFNETIDNRVAGDRAVNSLARTRAEADHDSKAFDYRYKNDLLNHQGRQQAGMYNHQGQNSVSQQNTLGRNQVSTLNTGLANSHADKWGDAALSMVASGQLDKKFDPSKMSRPDVRPSNPRSAPQRQNYRGSAPVGNQAELARMLGPSGIKPLPANAGKKFGGGRAKPNYRGSAPVGGRAAMGRAVKASGAKSWKGNAGKKFGGGQR